MQIVTCGADRVKRRYNFLLKNPGSKLTLDHEIFKRNGRKEKSIPNVLLFSLAYDSLIICAGWSFLRTLT